MDNTTKPQGASKQANKTTNHPHPPGSPARRGAAGSVQPQLMLSGMEGVDEHGVRSSCPWHASRWGFSQQVIRRVSRQTISFTVVATSWVLQSTSTGSTEQRARLEDGAFLRGSSQPLTLPGWLLSSLPGSTCPSLTLRRTELLLWTEGRCYGGRV